MHLYWNAWCNSRSTWLRERALAGSADRLLGRPEADWSWTDVTAVRLVGMGNAPPLDLTARSLFIAPDDGNRDDRTLLAVPLPTPLRPGETINLEVEWTAWVPRTFARTGVIGNFFFLAQWFPKIGVMDDSGWRARQFHAGTDFFADYGVYDVRLRVPHGWVVGATGREESRRDNGDGTTTHRYVQEDVHDFAWTTSPDLVEPRERFEHASLPPVDMRLLLQPEHAGQADRHFAATRAALRYYGEWLGPYPYGHITIVDPAWQSGAGGMEYPTVFTAGPRWLTPRSVTRPEGVTVHEAGHQFWYGLVGNNEFDDAWLDFKVVSHEQLGITDAHNHMWIEPVPGVDSNSPILNQFDLILRELIEYREKGGGTLLDCQPEGCGRNGNKLLALSKASGVHLIACTGFHRKKYYPQDHWLWNAGAQKVCDFLCSELEQGLLETIETPSPVRAGFIKIALEAAWADCPLAALVGAAAALKTTALMEVHTEKGPLAEKAIRPARTRRRRNGRRSTICASSLPRRTEEKGTFIFFD